MTPTARICRLFILSILAALFTAPAAAAFDPDAPPETTIPVAPFLTFGGNIALQYELELNRDLDNDQADALSILQPELSLALSFDPGEQFQAFVNIELAGEMTLAGGRRDARDIKLEMKEAFLSFKQLLGGRLFVQAGRQRFEDDRQWLYDEELDAVLVVWVFSPALSLELSASRLDLADRDFFNNEPRERIDNYIAYGRYVLGEDTESAAYAVIRHDRSADRESPILLGLHSIGEIIDNLDYWLEVAHARGRDGPLKIRGFGMDAGAIFGFDRPLQPAIALGFAFGTGDDDANDGVDTSFRQTGLQENEGAFDGVPDFKYYGESLDPELGNLLIFTVAAGIHPTEFSSIDLVYHYYLQHTRSAGLRNAGIDAAPDGRSRALGSEIDLVAGFEEFHHFESKLVLGYFIPGKAFPGGDNSALINFELQYDF
ncbi:MAG: alginate export family protein [Nitrospirota bacterium]